MLLLLLLLHVVRGQFACGARIAAVLTAQLGALLHALQLRQLKVFVTMLHIMGRRHIVVAAAVVVGVAAIATATVAAAAVVVVIVIIGRGTWRGRQQRLAIGRASAICIQIFAGSAGRRCRCWQARQMSLLHACWRICGQIVSANGESKSWFHCYSL